jgi:hypothetical protein
MLDVFRHFDFAEAKCNSNFCNVNILFFTIKEHNIETSPLN